MDIQKSRAGQAVSDETLANYTACRAFLFGEWVGALLMVASFGQLYYAVGSRAYSAKLALVVGVLLMVLGSFMYVRNRTYYTRLEFPWRRKWHVAALIVAGAGAVFWFMFLLLWGLGIAGVAILPE